SGATWSRPMLARGRPLSRSHQRFCRSFQTGPEVAAPQTDEQRIAVEQEAQRRLSLATSQTMALNYCRSDESNRFTRFFRGLSIDVNYDFRRWKKHQRAGRHFMLWTPRNILRSDNIRRLLFPDLAFIGATSSLLCYYNTSVASEMILSLPFECFTVTSMALGLLATFKTQASYARFNEGRSLWGTLINESRALTSRILTRVHCQTGRGMKVWNGQQHAAKLVRTFPLTLKYHLTEDGCNPHI
ncbi:unnamed protein product, partial [Polarella glacialis]